MNVDRSLRILFVVRPGTLLRFALLVPQIAERGHAIHFAFGRKPEGRVRRFLEPVMGRYPNVTYDVAPVRRETEGWCHVAWLVRLLGDVGRYAHPRYDAAPVLRKRMAKRARTLLRTKGFEPLGRRLALRAVQRLTATSDAGVSARAVALAARLEDAIPTSRRIDRYVRSHAPDVVLSASAMKPPPVSEEIDLLKSARRLRIPTGICVGSWDKLTNKGMIKFVPERVFVWNDVQVREAVELHAIPRERVIATGAHPFDEWFERQPSMTREGFTGGLGLDPERPYVLYLCSSPLTTGSAEIEFVRRWIEQLRADPHLGGLGIAVRPHPNSADEWQGVDLSGYGGVAVCESRHPIADDARSAFFDSIAHSAAVVGINTTAMIEAAILGKSVLTILNREFAQETTLHFHYLLAENGGFLHVAPSLEAHAEQLRSVLREDAAGAERRRRFVEAFVRPRGIDRRAAPILIDAIEELARTDPDPVARAAILHRLALGAEAALTRLFLAGRGLVPRGDGRVRAPRAVDAARPRDVRA